MKKTNNFLRGFVLLTFLFSTSVYAQTFAGNTGAIPDSSCNESHEFTNFVSGVDASYVVTDVDLNITHTWDSDLDIFLIAPDGTELELSTDNGSSGDDYLNTNFNALAATSITSGSAPFTGSFTPEGNMASLYASSPNGDWTLRVCDDTGGDTGDLNSWSITFGEEPELPPTPCELAEDITCGETVFDSTVGASSNNLPFCGTSLSAGPGRFYRFVGTGETIDIDVSTDGSDYDTKLGVFSGDCFNLTCVDGDDDGGPGLTSEVSFTTEVGTDYYIYVTGFLQNAGNYTLSLSCSLQASIGQDCSTVYFGYDPQACAELSIDAQYGELPYSYLWSTGETTATISVCPSSTTTYSVTVTDASGESVTDETTVVAVDVTCGNSNNGKVLICHRTSEGDYNTLCIAPSAVETHLEHGDMLGTCGSLTCDTAPGCDVVVTPSDGAIDVSAGTEISWTEASGFVLGYTISVGTTSGGTDVADNVDVGNSTSFDPGNLDFLTTYYVSVTPYNDNGAAEGCSESSFTTQADPCITAAEIFCGDTVTGSTVGASSSDVPFCGTSLTTAGGAWYTFTGDGSFISAFVATAGSDYDTKLGVFTGSCDALVCVGGNDDVNFPSDATSVVDFPTVDGETYYIYVTGFSTNEGNYSLSITCEEAPEPNVTCGETVNTAYCYESNDETAFYFESNDGSPLEVVFNSGEVENNFDELIVLDSDGTELYNGYGASGDLTGLTFTSTGSSITVMIDSDSTISCQSSSSIDGWDFSVSCAASERMAQPDFGMYPNPTKDGNVTLDLSDYVNQDLDIQIMDIRGNVITKESINNLSQPRHNIRMNNAVNGLYFVSIQTNRGVATKKLIIAY